MTELAIDGGRPVRDRPWPPWPRATPRGEELLLAAFRSGRWTVSGPFTGEVPYERRFSELFARYHDVAHCVPTCHGSSALTIALEALGVGHGAEVLVPGLTWVACASAVAGIGAIPVLVDVDRDTLCMSVDAAEAAITERTAAVMVVHLFCSAADLDGFEALCARHGLPMVEDCSQAHGAVWRGRRVGSVGAVGAFSFQQTKLLTCGEGGAVVTRDAQLADRMQQLRADGRRYTATPRIGHLDLEEVGAVQGRNFCLSELHAALLVEGLERLDRENDGRRANARRLERLLDDGCGVRIVARPAGLEAEVYYHLCLRVDGDAFGAASIDWIAAAVGAELGLPAEPVDRPLNDNPLYRPLRSPRTPRELRDRLDPARFALPNAEQARRTCMTLPHRALLGDERDMADVVAALSKVRAAALARASAAAGA